jgi:hypothetical protein
VSILAILVDRRRDKGMGATYYHRGKREAPVHEPMMEDHWYCEV